MRFGSLVPCLVGLAAITQASSSASFTAKEIECESHRFAVFLHLVVAAQRLAAYNVKCVATPHIPFCQLLVLEIDEAYSFVSAAFHGFPNGCPTSGLMEQAASVGQGSALLRDLERASELLEAQPLQAGIYSRKPDILLSGNNPETIFDPEQSSGARSSMLMALDKLGFEVNPDFLDLQKIKWRKPAAVVKKVPILKVVTVAPIPLTIPTVHVHSYGTTGTEVKLTAAPPQAPFVNDIHLTEPMTVKVPVRTKAVTVTQSPTVTVAVPVKEKHVIHTYASALEKKPSPSSSFLQRSSSGRGLSLSAKVKEVIEQRRMMRQVDERSFQLREPVREFWSSLTDFELFKLSTYLKAMKGTEEVLQCITEVDGVPRIVLSESDLRTSEASRALPSPLQSKRFELLELRYRAMMEGLRKEVQPSEATAVEWDRLEDQVDKYLDILRNLKPNMMTFSGVSSVSSHRFFLTLLASSHFITSRQAVEEKAMNEDMEGVLDVKGQVAGERGDSRTVEADRCSRKGRKGTRVKENRKKRSSESNIPELFGRFCLVFWFPQGLSFAL
uniref:Uncharacterized protein n=1 Tax=Chromera velia CCMP2878 TaxID=1169474 RepID=A0A0G4HIP4_9ALVE|eukprot:Cvel_27874.t1-p1 / transcript=Cvel_27874.t1 / gene=Cvel_27874 / organism=Chromera_velia_CCMP2878 / gene_product=hypothetical protein / transcript_product=hypothetical protein / location=Cvel_scaffold3549:6548-12659(+) / protein_length=555 / sequence_SO=supercontig / SO=protein_coding / is_pseudo=false